ncbi:DUF72 domain-containing protein [Prosthecobacter sp.]|uniref:DUF72 domain-containing protein n=1 Tax=Prosthecobacter sp. TaxID=1965333 RepID=UPI0037834C1B
MPASGQFRIGISGWRYPPWRGTFYPRELPQRRELEYAASQVNSIEINGSFYALQRPQSFRLWYESTPENFMFSVKGGRFITHLRRLQDVKVPLANFFASGVLCLKEKLGPFLWQLPPSLPFERDRLETFFDLLPRDTRAAARLARQHDAKVSGKASMKAAVDRPLRHALEVRHPSFQCREFVELLRAHGIALVVADTAGKWPFMEDVTSDFIYVRLHGDEKLYVSGYTPAALKEWARKLRVWAAGRSPSGSKLTAPRAMPAAKGRDVFVYFDNDVKVRAPYDAQCLAHRLGMCKEPPAPGKAEPADDFEPRDSWPERRTRRRAVSA